MSGRRKTAGTAQDADPATTLPEAGPAVAAPETPPVAADVAPTPVSDDTPPVMLPPPGSPPEADTAPAAKPLGSPPRPFAAPEAAAAPPPVDAAPETATPPRRTGFALPLLGGAVAAALGFGLAQVVPDGWPVAGQGTEIAALQTRLAEQDRQIAALLARPDPTGQLTSLEARIAGLSQPDLAPLQAEIEALRQAMPTGDTVSPDTIAALRAEIAALPGEGLAEEFAALKAAAEAERAEAAARAEAIRTEAEASARAAVRQAAVLRLRAALDTGSDFAPALADLAAAGIALPAALTAAEAGVPTLAALIQDYPAAARAALAASHDPAAEQPATSRFAAFLRQQTGMRSLTPQDGDHADAILSRAEAALKSGDLAGALAGLDGLSPPARAAMAGWRTGAEARAAAEVAIGDIVARLDRE